jgi:hypothetical protein
VATALAGCSHTLAEVRARPPEFRLAGVASSRQLEVARCVRDVLDQAIGGADAVIAQEMRREPDGMHVVGRPDDDASAALYDVAIREDAVIAMMASPSDDLRETLRYAAATCVGAVGPSR